MSSLQPTPAEISDPASAQRRRRLRALLFGLFLAVVLVLAVGVRMLGPTIRNSLHAANGYAAKWACSGVFVSQRPLEAVVGDLPTNPIEDWMRVELDEEERSVSASLSGLFGRTAVFRQGFGCTLVPPGSAIGEPPGDLFPVPELEPLPPLPADRPWPEGSREIRPEDRPPALDDAHFARLEAAIDDAFAEPDPADPTIPGPKNTRAVAVVYDGKLVAERYAPGIDRHTALPGWSMTKSLVNTLVGLWVHEGEMDIHRAGVLPEWQGESNPRRKLSVDHLLRMSSGLSFDEDYVNLESDAVRMLFVLADSGGFAAQAPHPHPVDTVWEYSSGTTNIISLALRHSMGSDEHYLAHPQRALFAPLGTTSAVIEPDPSGTFVGSSFGWATARDWARFGQLYLQDGVWNGERLLPEGWVDYSVTPTPAAPKGRYGAQVWLNAGEPDDPSDRRWPDLPTDLYHFSGFNGQSVVVVPSRHAVIVRLGLTQNRPAWDLGAFLAAVLDALPASEPGPADAGSRNRASSISTTFSSPDSRSTTFSSNPGQTSEPIRG